MFATKKARVVFHKPWGSVELDAYGNCGDVLALPVELARALIQSGVAEATTRPEGRAPMTIAQMPCRHCNGLIGEFLVQCPHCSARQR